MQIPMSLKNFVSLVRPHLEYAVPIWDPYTAKDCDLVESVQRFAGRVCLKSWDIGYPEILNSLNLPSLETRRKVQKLILLYKFVNNLALFPEAPLTFCTVNYLYSTCNVHNLSFCNLHGHTLQYLHSYFPDTINLWNTLPYNIISYKNHWVLLSMLCMPILSIMYINISFVCPFCLSFLFLLGCIFI